jgi:uncharacterized protein (TIGR01777 family)
MGNRIVLIGSTGLIGRSLARFLSAEGNEVTSVSRDPEKAQRMVPGLRSYEKLRIDPEEIRNIAEGSYAVINMSGSSAFEKYPDYDRIVRESRVDLTEVISTGISLCERKPEVFINSSASGYYGPGGPEETYNEDSPGGNDYWGNLVKEWEAATKKAEDAGIRTVKVRTGVILSREGGALSQLVPVFRKHLGGYIKPGNQFFSWIHIDDEVGIIHFSMQNRDVSGAVNAVSPGYVTSREFFSAIGKVMGRKASIGIPEFILKARVGKAFGLLASGAKIVPEKVLKNGYQFKYTNIDKALADIIPRMIG